MKRLYFIGCVSVASFLSLPAMASTTEIKNPIIQQEAARADALLRQRAEAPVFRVASLHVCSGKDYADRVYRETGREIPPSSEKGPGSDWNKIKKYGDRKK